MTCEGFERCVVEGEVPCVICKPPEHMSKEERVVMDTLLSDFKDHVFVPQCKPLLRFNGAVDFCLPTERVIIQVDGPFHFVESGFVGGTLQRQLVADRDCKKECLEQGWYLLRLHHNDVALHRVRWIQTIMNYSKRSLDAKNGGGNYAKSCVVFSRSWGMGKGKDKEFQYVNR